MTDAADETPPESEGVEPTDPAETAEPEKSAREETIEIVKTVAYALAVALVLRIFLFQPFTIPSSSMEPNLLIGDYVIVSKFSYGYSRNSIPFSPPLFKGRIFAGAPKRGDVIVFKTPAEGHKDLIKRLIGLPGDRIQMLAGVVHVNGQALKRAPDGLSDEPVCTLGPARKFLETNPEGRTYVTYDCEARGDLDDTDVFLVPEGHYFFLGDNRDRSADSRVSTVLGGPSYVPAENLVGKAETVLLSWNEGASILKPWTWLNLRWGRSFHSLKSEETKL